MSEYDRDTATFKGRDRWGHPEGENARAAKLDRPKVEEIKRRLLRIQAGATDDSRRRIAEDNFIGKRQVARIEHGEAWGNVPWPTQEGAEVETEN